MNSCLCVCALCVCVYCTTIQAKWIENENGFHSQELSVRRDTRSIFSFLNRRAQVGQKATAKLLQGAEKTEGDALFPKTYQKHGNYQTALKDFFSVQPRSVSRFGSNVGYEGMSGAVGDRILVVKSRQNVIGNPVLEIWNYKSKDSIENIDIISYVE